MAEELQPAKRRKTSEAHIEHSIQKVSPIGDELDSLIPIPIDTPLFGASTRR
jgi:hypothetical protein